MRRLNPNNSTKSERTQIKNKIRYRAFDSSKNYNKILIFQTDGIMTSRRYYRTKNNIIYPPKTKIHPYIQSEIFWYFIQNSKIQPNDEIFLNQSNTWFSNGNKNEKDLHQNEDCDVEEEFVIGSKITQEYCSKSSEEFRKEWRNKREKIENQIKNKEKSWRSVDRGRA